MRSLAHLAPLVRAWTSGLIRDRRGATAIEYGLIVALIVIAMVVALVALAGTTIDIWTNISTKVTNAR